MSNGIELFIALFEPRSASLGLPYLLFRAGQIVEIHERTVPGSSVCLDLLIERLKSLLVLLECEYGSLVDVASFVSDERL